MSILSWLSNAWTEWGKGTISSSPKEVLCCIQKYFLVSNYKTSYFFLFLKDIYFHHECNQGQAQYFFSEDTLDFLMGLLKRMKVTNILCVGTPSIHDLFKGASHLLDIDTKFVSGPRFPMLNFRNFNACSMCWLSRIPWRILRTTTCVITTSLRKTRNTCHT